MLDLTTFLRFTMEAGPFIWLQFLLAWVVVILALVNGLLLALRKDKAVRLRNSIDAVLFWGCLTAIFGFLGQWTGLHRVSKVVVDHGVINPQMVVLGLGESLNTTVFGMFTLVIAAFLWFALRSARSWRIAH